MSTARPITLTDARNELIAQPVYTAIESADDVRVFMKHQASFCHGREKLSPDVLGTLRDGVLSEIRASRSQP